MRTKQFLLGLAVCILLLSTFAQATFVGNLDSLEIYVNPLCPYNYIIDTNTTHYFMFNGTTGKLDYSSTNASVVFLNADGNLTSDGGGDILVRQGRYNITTPIRVSKGVHLKGEGSGSAVFSSSFYGTVLDIQVNSASAYGVYINGTVVAPNYDSGISDLAIVTRSTYAINASLYIGVVGRCEISNVYVGCGYSGGASVRLGGLNNAGKLWMHDCTFSGLDENNVVSGNGIWAPATGDQYGVDHLSLKDSSFFYMKTYGILVTGSSFYNEISGIHMGYGFDGTADWLNLYYTTIGSWDVYDMFFEVGETQRPNIVGNSSQILYINFGANCSALTMHNIFVNYHNTTKITDWSDIMDVARVGGGSIESFVTLVNFHDTGAAGAQHLGFIGITALCNANINRYHLRGNATITTGLNTVTVPHSLGIAPLGVLVIGSNSTVIMAYGVTAKTTTSFTIQQEADTGAGDVYYDAYW